MESSEKISKNLTDLLKARPVGRASVDEHKCRMLEEVRAYKLRELLEAAELTQSDVADLLQVR